MKATNNQINGVSRQLVTKAQSWGQVAKQLSGMTGKITLSKTEKNFSSSGIYYAWGAYQKQQIHSTRPLFGMV